MKRIGALLITAALLTPAVASADTVGGSLMFKHPAAKHGCAARITARATFRCSVRDPTVHVYVNHTELLTADMVESTATTTVAVYYGEQTIVRVTQSHRSRYRVSVVTLLPRRPLVWVRLRVTRS